MIKEIRKKLETMSVELTTIRTMVSDLHSCLVPRNCSSIKHIGETIRPDSLHTREDLSEAIRTLREYCDGQDSCQDCVFRDCRDGYDCIIHDLIESEDYEEAVK